MERASILLFDGDCALCNGAVAFIARRDAHGRFSFAPLGSPAGLRLRRESGISGSVDSLVFLDRGRAWVRSGAVLRIALRLGPPWSLLAVVWIVPAAVRDAAYDWVAGRRFGWFGNASACRLPSEGRRPRMVDR